jgi:hypothetical protein
VALTAAMLMATALLASACSSAKSCPSVADFCSDPSRMAMCDWTTAQQLSTWCEADAGVATGESVTISKGCGGFNVVADVVFVDVVSFWYYSPSSGKLVGAVGTPLNGDDSCIAGTVPAQAATSLCAEVGAMVSCGADAGGAR